MPVVRAGPLAEKVRTATAWLAVALVSWQSLVSVVDVASELGRPVEHHLRLRSSPEDLIRRKLGTDFELLEALRSKVPRDARVLVSFVNVRSDYPELRRRHTWLQSLVYPMVLEGWPLEQRTPPKKARQVYVLDLESGRDYSAWQCQELASGQHFRLLLVGKQPTDDPGSAR